MAKRNPFPRKPYMLTVSEEPQGCMKCKERKPESQFPLFSAWCHDCTGKYPAPAPLTEREERALAECLYALLNPHEDLTLQLAV